MARAGDNRQKVQDINGHVFNVSPVEMPQFMASNPGAKVLEATPAKTVEHARPEVEAGGDINAMNLNQLKRFAAAQGIDLGAASTKGDVLGVIVEHQNSQPAEIEAED